MKKTTKLEFTPPASINEEEPALILLNDGSGGPVVRNSSASLGMTANNERNQHEEIKELRKQLNFITMLITEIKELLSKQEESTPVRTFKTKKRKADLPDEVKADAQQAP